MTGTAPAINNGMVNASIVTLAGAPAAQGDFVTYGGAGFAPATAAYITRSGTIAGGTTGSTEISNVTAAGTTFTGNNSMYALRVASYRYRDIESWRDPVDWRWNESGGVIVNGNTGGASISGGTLAFGTSEGIIYSFKAANTISSLITGSNGVTIGGNKALTLSGALAPLTLNSDTTQLTTLTGGVTGAGNLVFNEYGTGGFTASGVALNNTGTITNGGSATGIGATTISGGVGSNVTGVIENSLGSALTIGTTGLTVATGGTTLTNSNSGGSALFTVTSGITGTGNLILNNSSAIANGITVSTTAINNTGTITNSGTGVGSTSISFVIGTNVTGVIQNSATSQLILGGANTFNGGLSIQNGTVVANANNTTTVSGAAGPSANAVITLGATGGTNSASLLLNSITVANNVVLGTTTGTLTIGTNGGATAPTFSSSVISNQQPGPQ